VPAASPRVVAILRAAWFWIRRYLPCELAGTAALLAVGTVVHARTGSAALTAVAGTVAETIGFYGAAFVVILLEQRRLHPGGRWSLLGRTIGLGLAEFGAIDLLDSLLVRPALLLAGTALLPSAALGLLAGKLGSDVVFYLGAATAYRITEALGLRRSPSPRPEAADAAPPAQERRAA
jgi:hypothetical protein